MLQMIIAVAAAVPPVCAAIAAILNLRRRSGPGGADDAGQVWTGRSRPQPPPLPTGPSVAPGWYVEQAQPANTWGAVRAAPAVPSAPATRANRWWQSETAQPAVEHSGRR